MTGKSHAPERETELGIERMCRHCCAWFPVDFFRKSKVCFRGYSNECKGCRNEREKGRRVLMSETRDLRAFIKWVNDLPYCFAARIHSGTAISGKIRMAEGGTPDAIVVIKGHYLWIEGKSEHGRVSKVQQKVHERIRRASGVVLVVSDWQAMRGYVREMLK